MPRRLLLAVVAGLCLWLALPGYDLWWLAPVGVAALAVAAQGVSRRRGALLGLATGLACFVPSLSWSGIYVGAFPWMALSTTEALYVAGLGALLAAGQRTGQVRPWLVACLWVLQELVRSTVPFGGFPWARIAFSQADSPFARLAALGGAPLVTFGVALLGGWAARTGLGLWRTRSAPGSRRARLRPSMALPAAAAVLCLLALGTWWPTPTDGRTVKVAGIQGNVPTAGLEFNAQRRAVLDNHAGLTHQVADDVRAGRTPRPDLVVWPENSSDIDPTRNPDAATAITRAVAAVGAPTVVGAVLDEPTPRVSNASLLYQPGRGITDRYVKQHPVPFAEYIPYRSFFRTFSDKVDLVTRDFAPGPGSKIFHVPTRAGTVDAGTLICFEAAYDDLTRTAVQDGADLLLVPTNNATFGHSDESVQQLAISRLRAVEHGRSVVHISTVGVSALITPDGVTHQRTGLFTRAAIVGDLPLRHEKTLATRLGRLPELLIAASGVALLAAPTLRRRIGRVGRQTPAASSGPVDGPPTDTEDVDDRQ